MVKSYFETLDNITAKVLSELPIIIASNNKVCNLRVMAIDGVIKVDYVNTTDMNTVVIEGGEINTVTDAYECKNKLINIINGNLFTEIKLEYIKKMAQVRTVNIKED